MDTSSLFSTHAQSPIDRKAPSYMVGKMKDGAHRLLSWVQGPGWSYVASGPLFNNDRMELRLAYEGKGLASNLLAFDVGNDGKGTRADVARPPIVADERSKADQFEELVSVLERMVPKGWKVEGEAKVVDGVLVVGGDKPATLKTTDTFGKLELRLEYRTEGKKDDVVVTMVRVFLLGTPNDKKDVWN